MIKIDKISKAFGEEEVLNDVSFDLDTNDTFSILGRSGSGKSTLLKILAGMEKADRGSFTSGDINFFKLKPQHRGVVYLSQEAFLFPHLTVFKNLSYGLEVRNNSRADVENKVQKMAEMLGLNEHLTKLPEQLSGGQKQRVNFGRALIIDPKVLLLDEPFSSLDAFTRKEMQELFIRVRDNVNITSIFVTHDVKEALTIGNVFGYINEGRLAIFENVKSFVGAQDLGIGEELKFWRRFMD